MKFRLAGLDDWRRFAAHVKGLPWVRDGKGIVYRVTVEEWRPTRSQQANARWWALMTAISQQAPAYMGGEYHHPEVWHEYLVRRFAGVEAGPYGHGVRVRTSTMRSAAFLELMAEVEAWAHQEFDGFTFEREAA